MYSMPPVEEDKPNMREESDYFPNMHPENSAKGRWTKGLKASRQLSVKQQQLAQEAVRAWTSATGTSWNEFTQNTTFHGIKYIFDSSPRAYKIRRFTWVACVVAAVLFFIIQVSLRVGVFFEYNTNVDVEKVYTTAMPFPAVTICNQNKFRLTVTSEKGLYGLTNAVYSGSSEAAMEEERQLNTEIDAGDFLEQTAHQLVDLIDSCTWKGKQCNTTKDWLMRQTDMGVCYTFNSGIDGEPALEVTESGAAQGLSLILNIEQYEYMMGPQNDAGIKILLHDQSEFPMIKDLGFAVAPGTHTLVGVNRFVIESMEHPYGLCDKQRNESMSDCRFSCYASEIVFRCGCRETHIGNETDAPLCSISQLFGCVKEEMEQLQMNENNCSSCTVPCTRINFEPALSYAQLSQLSIGRLVLKDPERRTAVSEQYKLAREVLQRTDPDVLTTDNATFTAIQSHIQTFTDTMDVVMSDIDSSRDKTLISRLQKSLVEDKEYLEKQVDKVIWPAIWVIVEEFDQYKDCIHDTVQFVKQFTLQTQNLSDVENMLVQCLSIKCNSEGRHDGGEGDNGGNGGNGGPPEDPGQQGSLAERLSQVPDSCMKLADVLDGVLLLPNKYASGIEDLFAGSLSDPSEIENHLSCLVELDKIEDSSVVNATRQLTGLMRSMFENSTGPDLLNVTRELAVVMNETSASELDALHMKAAEKCTWPKEKFPRDEKDVVKDIDRGEKTLQTVYSDYGEFLKEVSDINTILSDNIVVAKEAIENYTAGGITKLKLASVMRSHKVIAGLEDLRDSGDDLDGDMRPIDSNLRNAENDLHKGFEDMFHLVIPLLTPERIQNLSFLSFARSMDVAEINALCRNLSNNYPGNVYELVELVLDDIGDSIRSTKNNIAECMAEAEGALTELSEDLLEYQTNSKLNQVFFMQNFLQVDIFYRELNSEYIIQRPAFAASSLLGEVGGFLGLLLGASILTVCELLDYLFMSCWLKFQKKTGPGNDRRTPENLEK